MKPTIGRMVVYRQPERESPVNGTRFHPAVITRVWGHDIVNLTVFFDTHPPRPVPSVLHTCDAAEHVDAWDWPARET